MESTQDMRSRFVSRIPSELADVSTDVAAMDAVDAESISAADQMTPTHFRDGPDAVSEETLCPGASHLSSAAAMLNVELPNRAIEVGAGVRRIACRIQRGMLLTALADVELRGESGATAWIEALGRFGFSSSEARRLFELLARGASELSPVAFCDVELLRHASADVLTTSLDIMQFVQLTYRALVFVCRARGIADGVAICDVELLALLRAMGLEDLSLAEAAAVISAVGEVHRRGSVDGAPRIEVDTLCHQLALWNMSAPNLERDAFQSPSGSPVGGKLSHFVGKTPIEIVVQFKDPSTFPWQRLPESTCGRRFEELWRLATERRHAVAQDVVQLLTDPVFDRT